MLFERQAARRIDDRQPWCDAVSARICPATTVGASFKSRAGKLEETRMWKRSASVLLGTIFAALFVLPLATASAAPQALGLAATPEPMPLHCEDGLCTAFLTAFCLQENRPQPEDGIAYLPTETSVINLLVSTKDGRTLTLPGRDYVEFLRTQSYRSDCQTRAAQT